MQFQMNWKKAENMNQLIMYIKYRVLLSTMVQKVQKLIITKDIGVDVNGFIRFVTISFL